MQSSTDKPVDTSIIEKIQKLLELSDPKKNSSESERNNAMSAVRALLDKNQLDMTDVLNYSPSSPTEITHMVFEDTRIEKWTGIIFQSVAALYNCHQVDKCMGKLNSKLTGFTKWKIPLIIGTKENIQIVHAVATWCIDSIKYESRKFNTVQDKKSFKYGAAIGIMRQIDSMIKIRQEDVSTTGNQLIVISNAIQKAISDYAHDTFPNIRTSRPRTSYVSKDAFEQGKEHGANMHLGKRPKMISANRA